MLKTDIHLHLLPESIEFVSRAAGARQSYVSGDKPHPPTIKMSGTKDMLPHLKELGIGHGIVLSTGNNDQIQAAAELVPNVYKWMCNVDPTKDTGKVKDVLSHCKELGAVGVGEFAVNEWIGSPFIEEVFTAAEELGLPILFHMSPEEGFNYGIADHPGLPLLEQALANHPHLILIGHSQPFWHEISADAAPDKVSRNSWGSGPVVPGGRVETLLDKYPNLYCDLSANSGGNAIMRDEAFGLAFLEKYQDRLMFGTDMTNVDMVFPLGGWLDKKLAEGVLSIAIYEKICVHNAARLFGGWPDSTELL